MNQHFYNLQFGGNMVKYTQNVSVSTFIMYYAYKNITVTLKWMEVQY